jgi:hypothetical protein
MEKDQRDLLIAFNEQSVRYILVGGYALGRSQDQGDRSDKLANYQIRLTPNKSSFASTLITGMSSASACAAIMRSNGS